MVQAVGPIAALSVGSGSGSLVGGVDISFDPFSDISSEFEGRLGVIGEENAVSTRLRGLMSLND